MTHRTGRRRAACLLPALADDGLRIVAEVENIGPGLSRDLVTVAKPGSYFTACKPGMVGDGIRAPFTVTDSGADVAPTGELADQIAAATTGYVAYIKDQTEQLLTGTEAFVTAYTAGDDDEARKLYAPTRVHWERIEPVAESFGDLDPRMDLREADLAEGEEWTGWHLLEKDLWQPDAAANGGEEYVPLTDAQRKEYADQLLAGGRRIGLIAVDDAHFACMDAFGGWLMVKAQANDPDALLAALKAGAFYATQGPAIHDVVWGDEAVEITCSPAASVMLLGRGSRAVQHVEPGTTRAILPYGAHKAGGYARIVVADEQGRRAWANPVHFDH